MSFIQAFMVTLVYAVASFVEPWFAFPMFCQPLVLGPLVGLVMGDLKTGVMCGATCQMIFLGIMGIGGTIPPDSTTGTVIGTAFAIAMNQSVEMALTIAVPAAILGSFTFLLGFVLRGLLNLYVETLIDRGDSKAISRLNVWGTIIPTLPGTLIIFMMLYWGSGVVQSLVDNLPEWVVSGLGVATGMMVAVGIGLLLRMMWSKSMAVYFFAGFLLVSFFNVPIIGVAALAIVLVGILYLEGNSAQKSFAVGKSDEGGFFDD